MSGHAPGPCSRAVRAGFARYLSFLTGLSLVWEFAQMPLYTLWRTGSPGEIV